MEATQKLGTQIGQKSIRTALALLGLLIIRGVVSILPMVRNAGPIWHRSWLDLFASTGLNNLLISGANPSNASFASDQLAMRLAQEWSSLLQNNTQIGQALQQARAATPSIQAFVLATLQGQYGSHASTIMHQSLSLSHWAIFPSTLVHAVVDTLMLLVLALFGLQLRKTYQEHSHYPAIGQIMNLVILATVAIFAYEAYQGLFYPLLGHAWIGIYGWIFLAAGLLPLGWAAILVSQNLDSFSTAIFRANRTTASALPDVVQPPHCPQCGQLNDGNSKFCPHCGGKQLPAPETKKWCSGCGAEIMPTAKFCGRCGHSIV